MIVATEQIFYTSKNSMLFWWLDVFWPAFRHEEAQVSYVKFMIHLGLPRELREQTRDVLRYNFVSKANAILCKTQLCPLV